MGAAALDNENDQGDQDQNQGQGLGDPYAGAANIQTVGAQALYPGPAQTVEQEVQQQTLAVIAALAFLCKYYEEKLMR